MTVISKRLKTAIKHPRERKKLLKQKMVKNNSKLLSSGKFDFDHKKFLDNSLLFTLKETSEEKIFDFILKKIPDKNDIYYIEHREGMKTFRIRKVSKQAKKDKLITMLETVERDTKRATSKSKLSHLKRIKKQFIKNGKIPRKNLLSMNELKKVFQRLQTDAENVLFTEEKKISAISC